MKRYSRRQIMTGVGVMLVMPSHILAQSTARGKYYVLLHDEDKCTGCNECITACNNTWGIPQGYARLHIVPLPKSADATPRFFRHACQHCEPAPCIDVCPTGASWRDELGLTQIDSDRCLGCDYCVQACQYKVRYIHPVQHIADKCDLCKSNRLTRGFVPVCVRICPWNALSFGEIAASDIALQLAISPWYQHHLAGTTQSRVYHLFAEDEDQGGRR